MWKFLFIDWKIEKSGKKVRRLHRRLIRILSVYTMSWLVHYYYYSLSLLLQVWALVWLNIKYTVKDCNDKVRLGVGIAIWLDNAD
jgi:hypothetical protein